MTKNIEIRTFVMIALMVLAIIVFFASARYHQELNQNDKYAMSEPFSSGPLFIYASLEAAPYHSDREE